MSVQLVKQCDANADCIAYGQQSNGCWHTLKWDSTETGANKKLKVCIQIILR